MELKSWGLVEAQASEGASTMFPGPGVSLLQPVHLWFSFIAMFNPGVKELFLFWHISRA